VTYATGQPVRFSERAELENMLQRASGTEAVALLITRKKQWLVAPKHVFCAKLGRAPPDDEAIGSTMNAPSRAGNRAGGEGITTISDDA